MQVKAVCSSGGHFMKLTGGSFEYQGGETRLISVPNFCRYQDLLESLERLAGSAAGSTSGSSSSVRISTQIFVHLGSRRQTILKGEGQQL